MLKTAIILLCVLALDGLLPKISRWRPLFWLEKYTATLVRYLQPSLTLNAPRRHVLRGLFALILQFFPILPMALLYYAQPDQTGILDLVLLYIVFDYVHPRRQLRILHNHLIQGQLAKAKEYIRPWLKRDPSQMSAPELARTTLESYAISQFRNIFGLLFWFIFFGGLGAWVYWLSMQFDRQCAKNGKSLTYFRAPAQWVCDFADWLPARIFAVTVLISSRPRHTWRCWRTQAWQWHTPAEHLVLAITGGRLGLMLGGPTLEYGLSVPRPYLGLGDPVTARDLRRVEGLINQCLWRWVLTDMFLAWVIYQPFNLDAPD
ncbi:MAG: cobalamin biosynthesis protein [Gammaproteobacteria bacterium]|nr:cobalamin biosynthesis protein [Gammaproteobacteria bacterium]